MLKSYRLIHLLSTSSGAGHQLKDNQMFRSLLRSAGLGLAAAASSLLLIQVTAAEAQTPPDQVDDLVHRYAKANEVLLQGDSATWQQLAPMTEDFVLMSPFGGKPSRHADYPPERIARMGQFFRNGRFRQELVQSYATEGMIVLVTIERANVEVGELPAQDWSLRVTSVFTRDGTDWKLAHRHADPLVDDVSLGEAARLAKGVRMAGGQ